MYVEGAHVDAAATPVIDSIDKNWVLNRERRDGGSTHHITIVEKRELHRLSKNGAELVRLFAQGIADDRDKRKLTEPFDSLGFFRWAYYSTNVFFSKVLMHSVGIASEGQGAKSNCAVFVVVDWPAINVCR